MIATRTTAAAGSLETEALDECSHRGLRLVVGRVGPIAKLTPVAGAGRVPHLKHVQTRHGACLAQGLTGVVCENPYTRVSMNEGDT